MYDWVSFFSKLDSVAQEYTLTQKYSSLIFGSKTYLNPRPYSSDQASFDYFLIRNFSTRDSLQENLIY